MATQTWQLDTAHSSIGFTVRHMMVAKVHGRFSRFDGTIVLPDGELARGSVEATIDATSIETHMPARDAHLRSPDFFDVEKFPQLSFRSTSIEASGGERFKVKGQLTLRGITREVELEAEFLGKMTDPFGAERVAFTAATRIDRKDFGLTWNKALETGGMLVADRIDIQLEVQATRGQEQPATQAA